MTIPEMIAEWRRGCSCAEPGKPEQCRDCTKALIEAIAKRCDALESLSHAQHRLGYQEGKEAAFEAYYEVKEYAKKLGLRLWDGKLV
jgi:flagellar biosynthesis/type III secretory pathway protein FliH